MPDFNCKYNFKDRVGYTDQAIAKEGTVVAIKFTQISTQYDILDSASGEVVRNIDSKSVYNI